MKKIFVWLAVVVLLAGIASAATLNVGPSQTHKTIQSAIDSSSSGDTIKVFPGTYHETLSIRKSLTIEGADPLNPPVLDGADQDFNPSWTHVQGNIYKTPYTWYTNQISDEDFTAARGGMYRDFEGVYWAPMQVFEDGILLRGYRNRWDPDFPSGVGGAYRTIDELDPQNDDGSLPSERTKDDLRIPGRFLYDEANNELFVWGANEDNPSSHEYSIPNLVFLMRIDAPNTIIRNFVIKNAGAYAITIEDSDNAVIENNYFINNIQSLVAKRTDNLIIRNNFIQTKGFWERYWYDDCKQTILWTHAIVIATDDTNYCQIYNNTIHGTYSAFLIPSPNMKIYNNIVSNAMSTHVSTGDYQGTELYNLEVFNNIFHHVDDNSIGVSNQDFGPAWFYRNLFYACKYFNKDGGSVLSGSQGKSYFYHNTVALSAGISHHPYIYPPNKNTFYRNNIYYMKYRDTYERYWNYAEKDPALGWDFFPFDNGPDSDYNLYWEVHPNDDNDGIAYMYSTDEGRHYQPGDFSLMQLETELDMKGLEADPLFEKKNEFISIDVKNIKYDTFSTMDYKDVITNGYENLFGTHFKGIWDTFKLSQESPAINKGTTLPTGWPDNVEVNDGNPDLGAIEYDGSVTPPSPPPEPEPIEGDLNNDTKVNINDLIIVAINFGLTSGFDIEADTDNNNVIDIFDVVYVASRFT